VLAAALLGGLGGVASAATPTVGVSGVGTTTPVLRQHGSLWKTTVLVSDSSGCANLTYSLATTPYEGPSSKIFPGPGSTAPGSTAPKSPGTTAPQSPSTVVAGGTSDRKACEVTLTFNSLTQVPVTAVLIVDQSGTTASVALTVSRDVTELSYLGWPAAAGGIMVALYLLFLWSVTIYNWRGTERYRLTSCAWWKHRIAGSGAWSASDSWATNMTTGLVVVGTVLSATTASSALFPGVALDRFSLVNILAGVLVVAAPLLFAILYTRSTVRDPGPCADSVVKVPPGERVIVRVPSGAAMAMVTTSTVSGGPPALNPYKPGDSYQIAPGSVVAIEAQLSPCANSELVKVIAFSGTSDIGVLPGTTVRAGFERELGDADALPISVVGGDRSKLRDGEDGPKFGGAKLTVTGTADVNLPTGAVISSPRQQDGRPAPTDRWLIVPQGSTVIIGNLGIMVAANIFTMFGIGAELGIAFVLAHLSEANGIAALGIYFGLFALGCFVLRYAISATRAMANPQPGSALSAQAGTSFTL
jgi:hypothetical protein